METVLRAEQRCRCVAPESMLLSLWADWEAYFTHVCVLGSCWDSRSHGGPRQSRSSSAFSSSFRSCTFSWSAGRTRTGDEWFRRKRYDVPFCGRLGRRQTTANSGIRDAMLQVIEVGDRHPSLPDKILQGQPPLPWTTWPVDDFLEAFIHLPWLLRRGSASKRTTSEPGD